DMDEFFEVIFSDKRDDDRIQIITIKPRRTLYLARTIQQAIAESQRLNRQGQDVYVSVGLAPGNYSGRDRCDAQEIAGITALYADIDLASPDKIKKTYPPDEASVRHLLQNMHLAPT